MAQNIVPGQQMQAAWSENVAAVKALHVMLLPDDGGWFAQGLEIDYAASGKTQEEAKNNFGQGLGMTFCEHLIMYGHIKKALVPAGQEAWDEYYKTPADKIEKQTCNLVAFLQQHSEENKPIGKMGQVVPFDAIEFIQGQAAA